jgi:hypothetical protein
MTYHNALVCFGCAAKSEEWETVGPLTLALFAAVLRQSRKQLLRSSVAVSNPHIVNINKIAMRDAPRYADGGSLAGTFACQLPLDLVLTCHVCVCVRNSTRIHVGKLVCGGGSSLESRRRHDTYAGSRGRFGAADELIGYWALFLNGVNYCNLCSILSLSPLSLCALYSLLQLHLLSCRRSRV